MSGANQAVSLTTTSFFIKVNNKEELHLKRFSAYPKGKTVFLIHGSIENGQIFYSKSNKGLAPFLAKQGFDVFVPDLRGRGLSKPLINKNTSYGQTESIIEDIPAFVEKIKEITGQYPEHWMGHSWGGVLAIANLVRFAEVRKAVKSMTFFGTKRRITPHNLEYYTKLKIMWHLVGRLMIARYGYLPAKEKKFGSENEPAKYFTEVNGWLANDHWKSTADGFDYTKSLQELQGDFPPILHIAGKNDTYLAHEKDIKRLMKEINNPKDVLLMLSKQNGFLHDYGHIDMVTHKDAPTDHFPKVVAWMKQHEF